MVIFKIVPLLFATSNCARISKVQTNESSTLAGRISQLYTFGAPHPSSPALTTKNGGCFAGRRITAFRNKWYDLNGEDVVPTLLVPTKYEHPNIKTLVIHNKGNGRKTEWGCGKNPFRLTKPSPLWHLKSYYKSLMNKLPSAYSRAKQASAIGLSVSYEDSLSKVRSIVNGQGWRLVGTAKAGEDLSHLIQHPGSKRCILTFEGSDSFNDWVRNGLVDREGFCGPMRVHKGFRNELRTIVQSAAWQNNIRPKLGKCSEVDAVGHSLGGAQATLFAACADSQNGSADYKSISWQKQASVVMPAV